MKEILLYSTAAGFATLAGGLAAYFLPKGRPWLAFCGSLAGGLMLAVSLGELFPAARQNIGLLPVLSGTGLGFALLWQGEYFLRLIQPLSASPLLRSAILIAGGIALHDFPEGAAISIGFELQESLGLSILLAIALHNLPEGLAVAVPLAASGQSIGKILLILTAVSLCTPLGAALGLVLAHFLWDFIGALLALAAGAMLYVALCQLLPEAWKNSRFFAMIGVGCGFFMAAIIAFLGA